MKLEAISDSPSITLAPRDDKARRRANAAPDYKLPFTAESLERGVDLETLLALPVPVLAYATQLTIHGILADFQPGLVSTYKHLTRNANGSLGVRWGAIDAGKKKSLRNSIDWVRTDTAKKGTPWTTSHTSKGTCVFRSVATVAEGREVIAALPPGIYGSAYIGRCLFTGTLWVDVSIGAIAAASLWHIISHFAPGYDCPEKLTAREAIAAEQRAREEAERELARQEKLRQHQAHREELLRLATSHLRPFYDWKPGPSKFLRITDATDYTLPSFKIITLEKRGARLCRMIRDGKGTALDKHDIALYQRAANNGTLYHYDEERVIALSQAVDALLLSYDTAEKTTTPPLPAPPAPTPEPAIATASALDLF